MISPKSLWWPGSSHLWRVSCSAARNSHGEGIFQSSRICVVYHVRAMACLTKPWFSPWSMTAFSSGARGPSKMNGTQLCESLDHGFWLFRLGDISDHNYLEKEETVHFFNEKSLISFHCCVGTILRSSRASSHVVVR